MFDTWRTSSYRKLSELGTGKDDILLQRVYYYSIRNTNVVCEYIENKSVINLDGESDLYWADIDKGELLNPYAKEYCQDYLNICLRELID